MPSRSKFFLVVARSRQPRIRALDRQVPRLCHPQEPRDSRSQSLTQHCRTGTTAPTVFSRPPARREPSCTICSTVPLRRTRQKWQISWPGPFQFASDQGFTTAETEGFELAPMATETRRNRMIPLALTSRTCSSIRSAGFDSWQKRGGGFVFLSASLRPQRSPR